MEPNNTPGASLDSANDATQILKNMLKISSGSSDVGSNHSGGSGSASASSFETGNTNAGTNGHHNDAEYSSQSNSSNPHLSSNGTGHSSIDRLLPTEQNIVLSGDDEHNSFSVYAEKVIVESSNTPTRATGSNKVRTNTVVKYDWQNQYYIGNLIAIHRNGVYLAYVLKGKSGGVVRVINRHTAERALLKGYAGSVIDLSFAHSDTIMLGSVDEAGNMYIHELREQSSSKLEAVMVLTIHRDIDDFELSQNHRLIWCPFIPDDEESSDATANNTTDSSLGCGGDDAKLLVLTHGSRVEVWNVGIVSKEHGSDPLCPSDIQNGFVHMIDHGGPVLTASLAPDGTALATAGTSGDVKFFEVCLHESIPPRFLHQWQPHDGKAVSLLFFLDDHKRPNPEAQFWKFVLTGAKNNCELKIWSCQSWQCFQTIQFIAPQPTAGLSDPPLMPHLKACMDLSSQYLVMSDIQREVLYILQLHIDMKAPIAHISSISEFSMAQPCLSMAVLDASRREFIKIDHDTSMGDCTTGEVIEEEGKEVGVNEDGPNVGVFVKMYAIHTKVLQELQIRFRPESSVTQTAPVSVSSSSHDGIRDMLSDFSMDTMSDAGSHSDSSKRSQSIPLDTSDNKPSALHEVSHVTSDLSSSDSPRVLMTPDAFTSSPTASSRKAELPSLTAVIAADSITASMSNHSSLTHVTDMDDGGSQGASPRNSSRNSPMRSPEVSTNQSLQHSIHLSSASSTTLTPSSSKDLSIHASGSGRKLDSSVHVDSAEPIIAGGFHTPVSPHSITDSRSTILSSPTRLLYDIVPPTLTSSPAAGNRLPSMNSSATGDENDVYEDAQSKTSQQSTGGSSATSLEISGILELASKQSDVDQLTEEVGSIATTEADTSRDSEIGTGHDSSSEEEDEGVSTAWPHPPDVQHTAKQLASEALQNAGLRNTEGSTEDGSNESDHQESDEGAEVVVEDDDGAEELEELQEQEPDKIVHSPVHIPLTSETDVVTHVPTTTTTHQPVHTPQQSPLQPAVVPPASVPMSTTEHLENTIQRMMIMMEKQQHELTALRQELSSHTQAVTSIAGLQTQLDSKQDNASFILHKSLQQQAQMQNEQLQRSLVESESRVQQKHEQLMNAVTQTVDRSIGVRMERVVKQQMKTTVVPMISSIIEPLRTGLHMELSQKLTATDALMKENVTKLMTSKKMVEQIGTSAGNSIQAPVVSAMRDILVPGFERACQSMTQQVQQTFQAGTREYVQQLNTHLDNVRQNQSEGRDPVVREMRSIAETCSKQMSSNKPLVTALNNTQTQLADVKQHLSHNHAQLQTQLDQAIARLEKRLTSQFNRTIKSEVSTAMANQQDSINTSVLTAMRESGAMTPAPGHHVTPDPQQQQGHIIQLLSEGRINDAFKEALQASDLSLVLLVCETVEPSHIFDQTPCPLDQPILLSLIQQLSCDLTVKTEIKHRYLEDSVIHLDMTNMVTREHMSTVIETLCNEINKFLQTQRHHPMSKSLKMLLMASQSMLK